MEMNNHFASCCRKLNASLKSSQLSFKKILSGKKAKVQTGTVCKFSFDDFNIFIYYIEKGKTAYAQQTLWLAMTVDNEPNLVFSIYDILAFIEPENFNCYTYTYVDSEQLMADCFAEIGDLFSRLIPKLKSTFESGIQKNKLIEIQKNNINGYFGDKILEANDMMGGVADRLISMMLSNFFEYQIECAVVGGQALFYSGKTEKALKALKKSKARSQYESNLISYLENGGKAPDATSTVKKASSENGGKRHNKGALSSLRILALTLLINIPFSLIAGLLFFLVISIRFNDALYICGIAEGLLSIFIFSALPSAIIAFKLSRRITEKKNNKNNIKVPKESVYQKAFLKYATIFAETLFIIQFITCINSVTVFSNASINYAVGDFPLSQQTCSYEAIEFSAIVNEKAEKPFLPDEKYLVLYTKSGTVIDLYNSSFLSAEETKNELSDVLTDKNISIKEYSSVDLLISENRK